MVKTIKLLALDIDGVLTDGRTNLGGRRPEKKRLAFQDLDAINAAKRAGLRVALVTGESDGSVDLVAARTGVTLVRRGAKDKLAALLLLSKQLRISLAEICYVGDGNRDAPALARVGFAVAPANATLAAKSAAHRQLDRSGGHGAVEEAVRLLLNLLADGKNEKVIQRELRWGFLKSKIALRHLPKGKKLADGLVSAFHLGGKILLWGEDAETALGTLSTSRLDWPAVALSRDRVTQVKQLRALARPGDMCICFGVSVSAAKIAILEKLGVTAINLEGRQAAALWRAAVGAAQEILSRAEK